MAIASKPSVALSLLPLYLWMAWRMRRARPGRLAAAALVTVALTLLPVLPWLVKNGAETGNPFVPFLAGTFPSPEWTPTEAEIYRAHAREKGGLGTERGLAWPARLAGWLSLPLRVSLAPLSRNPHLSAHPEDWFGDWPPGPWLLALLPLLLATLLFVKTDGGQAHPPTRCDLLPGCGAALWLFVAWAATYRDVRFLLPAMALLLPLYVRALSAMEGAARRLGEAACLVLILGQGGMAASFVIHSDAPWVVLGMVSRKDFLHAKVPDNFTPALAWAAEHVPPDGRALLVGLNHTYYLRFPVLAGDFFSTPPLARMAQASGTVQELEARLRAAGVTHVILCGKTLAKTGYQYWFGLHFLPPDEVGRALAEPVSAATAAVRAAPAWRLVGAWLVASPHLVRVYPAGPPPPPGRGSPWGLPDGTVIFRLAPAGSD